MRARLRLFACLLFVGGLGTASRAEEFSFWPGDGAERAAGFQAKHGHPCGEVARANVSKLPTADKGPLISELTVELNARGKVIRRWPMPVDYTPRALRGNELLAVAGDKGFWIRPNGKFRRAEAIPPADDSLPFQCDLASVVGKSAYAGCQVFVDLASRKKRTLGYQGVCT